MIHPLACLFIFVQINLLLSDLLPQGMDRYPVLQVIYCRYGIVRAATKCAPVFSVFPLPLQTANNSNPHIEVTHRISLEIISTQKGKLPMGKPSFLLWCAKIMVTSQPSEIRVLIFALHLQQGKVLRIKKSKIRYFSLRKQRTEEEKEKNIW